MNNDIPPFERQCQCPFSSFKKKKERETDWSVGEKGEKYEGKELFE